VLPQDSNKMQLSQTRPREYTSIYGVTHNDVRFEHQFVSKRGTKPFIVALTNTFPATNIAIGNYFSILFFIVWMEQIGSRGVNTENLSDAHIVRLYNSIFMTARKFLFFIEWCIF
jgi:hypothetical protein